MRLDANRLQPPSSRMETAGAILYLVEGVMAVRRRSLMTDQLTLLSMGQTPPQMRP